MDGEVVDGEVFVGRGGELALLGGLVGGLGAGAGGVVLVEGEQGIGKSALLRAGLGGVAGGGVRLAWGAADVLGQRFPLGLMGRCVGGGGWLGGVVAGGDAGLAGVAFAGDPVLAGVERVLALVDRWCGVSPVVLVAEDLQWADEASLLVWDRLCRAAGQLPLLLAGSCRPGPGPRELGRLRRGVVARAGGSVVRLGPLGAGEVAELVGCLVGGRPGEGLAGVVARAGGNPLYARELADALVREGRVRVRRGVAELAGGPGVVRVPVSLAAAVADRVGVLPAETVGVLRWAAVLGVEFSVGDLGVVTGRTAGELMGVVDEAVAGQVVSEAGPRLVFRHGLIRQVLYEGMPVSLRSVLHRQAARALAAAGAAAERVAAQLVAAGAGAEAGAETGAGAEAEAGAEAGLAAGAGAEAEAVGAGAEARAEPGAEALAGATGGWETGWLAEAAPALAYRAPRVAAELLRAVLVRVPGTDARRAVLEAALITAAFLLMRDEEVQRVGRQVLARAGDPDRAAEAAWLVAYTLARAGQAAEGIAAVEQALALPGVSEARVARLCALRALILTALGQYDRAGQAGEEALAIAQRTGDRFAAGYALHALAQVRFVGRDHAARLAHLDRALAVIGDDPQAMDLRLLLLANKAAVQGNLGGHAEAITTARQALALAERAGTPRLGMIRCALALQYFEAGQWDDALAELEPAAGQPGSSRFPLLAHGLLAQIAGHRDDRHQAAKNLEAVADQAIGVPAPGSNPYALLLARALAAEQAGQTGAAADVLAACLQPGVAQQMPARWVLLPELVRLALTADDAATAAAAAQAAAQEAEREPLPVKAAAADLCRGLLAGDPGPVLAAAGYYEAIGRPFDRALALENAAVLAAGRGDLAAARKAFAAAVSAYAGLGAAWDIRRAGARLRPYGIRRSPNSYRPRPATGWAALTPTEVKVGWLVAGGRSNPDIAAELFLSRNTVQTHVSHILAKLGARSRAEIVREALQHQEAPTASSAQDRAAPLGDPLSDRFRSA